MVDLRAVVTDVRDALAAELAGGLLALYLFGSAARGDYLPGRSDIDLLAVVDPEMPLAVARTAFRSLFARHGVALVHGPLVATPEDLALHLALFPSLHRSLLADARLVYGEEMLERLPPPLPPDGIDEAAYVAARAITDAVALTPDSLPPPATQRRVLLLDRLTRRVTGLKPSSMLQPQEAMAALHAKLRQLAVEMPQFEWHGAPPTGEVPDLLPGCLAFYQYQHHLIAVLERVTKEVLSSTDWRKVGAAAEHEHAQIGLATPWQLRLVASQWWVDSLYFQGFEHVWGADILEDVEADEMIVLRRLARVSSEQRVEVVPSAYLTIEDAAVPKLIHDTQNVLLNAGLRAELFARFTGRDFYLPDWNPPGREVPQPERVAATWERWREMAAHYAQMWREAIS